MREFYNGRRTDAQFVDDRLIAVVSHLAALSPNKILDLACGRGVLMSLLRERLPAAELVGADISSVSVATCRDLGFDCVEADVSRSLPFEVDQFDAVVFGEVIEHLVDPDFALQEIARVLRVGGNLIVTTPNLASWFNRILLLAGVQPVFTETSVHVNLGRRMRALGQWNSTEGHLKIFTLPALREMLTANGLEVLSSSGAPFYVPTSLKPLDRLISKIPALAANLIVVARNNGQRETRYPQRFQAYI